VRSGATGRAFVLSICIPYTTTSSRDDIFEPIATDTGEQINPLFT
jgi:hypothetical protein